jgi:L-amino acid N-acyltransferase YncA
MDIKIRNATRKDLDSELRLNRALYREVAADPSFGDWVLLKRPPKAGVLKRYARLLASARRGDAVYVVAEVDGQFAGRCFVTSLVPGSELSHVGEVTIMVDVKCRGRGIGGRLLDEAIRQSKGKFEMLRLYVLATNKVARHLYASRGFKLFGTEPRAVKRGSRYIDMEYYYRYL